MTAGTPPLEAAGGGLTAAPDGDGAFSARAR